VSSAKFRKLAIGLMLAAFLMSDGLAASNVAVRYKEGVIHGFLALSTLEGDPLAEGDLTQVARGNQLTTRVTFRFKDGSKQDETTVSSQRDNLQLVSYHLVQEGPAFQQPTELSIVAATGQVTVRYTDDKGNKKVDAEHLKLPPDLANGLVVTFLKNVPPGAPLPQLSMVVATPKPRIVKLSIHSEGTEPFSVGGTSREATHYVIKVDIGGVAGVVAPLVGKQPPDAHLWMIGGDVPAFVKSETLSYAGGPLWRMEILAPLWPKSATDQSKKAEGAKP
jgi:hypothetical protein